MERSIEQVEIDLLELLFFLKKKLVVILAVFLIFGIAGFVGTKWFVPTTYTTDTRMYVLSRSNENSMLTSDFQIANYVMNDYKELITGQNVTKEVVSRLGLKMTPNALSAKIVVTSPANTRVLQISITDENPRLAAQIANTVRDVAATQIEQIMDASTVRTVYEAEVPRTPSGPNIKRNTLQAAFVGLVIALCTYTAIFLLDDSIRTEEDVTRYLGLGTLGVIPTSAEIGSLDTVRASKKRANPKPSFRSVFKK